jgi:hypothetical protein
MQVARRSFASEALPACVAVVRLSGMDHAAERRLQT